MKIQIHFFQEDFINAIGAGVYEISVTHNGKTSPLYIGESVFVLVRCATHLYALKKNPAYLGFTIETINDPNITLTFRLIEPDDDGISRKQQEKALIKERGPICQSGQSDYMKKIDDKVTALTQFLEETQSITATGTPAPR